ncbi:hypothetical protein ACLMJK_005241 [Lecanora helva]
MPNIFSCHVDPLASRRKAKGSKSDACSKEEPKRVSDSTEESGCAATDASNGTSSSLQELVQESQSGSPVESGHWFANGLISSPQEPGKELQEEILTAEGSTREVLSLAAQTAARDWFDGRNRSQRRKIEPTRQARGLDETVDEELEDLLRFTNRACSHLHSPLGRVPDPYGYTTRHEYPIWCYVVRDRWGDGWRDRWTFKPVLVIRMIKIEDLPELDHNRLYERALDHASVSQVREQYDLQCQRFQNIRQSAAMIQRILRRAQRQGNMDYEAWICISAQMNISNVKNLRQKCQFALEQGQTYYDLRNRARILENGIVRLLERCESELEKQDKNFEPRPWRAERSHFKPRWADGRRGWTGLEN